MILAVRAWRGPLVAIVVAVTAAASTVMAAGCGEPSKLVVGIAMGAGSSLPQALLAARQQRFNDSVGTRHAVTLRFPQGTAASITESALGWANELVRTPGLVGVVGHESSRTALQAATVYRENEVVQVAPTVTSAQLATVSPWTFPLVAPDSAQGELLARELIASGHTRVTFFVQDDEYGRGIVKALKRALRGSAVQILENVSHTPDSDSDLLVRSVLSHVPSADAIVLVTQGAYAARLARLLWKGDSTLLIMGSDAATGGATELRAAAPTPNQLMLATYWVPDTTSAVTRAFLRDFRESKLPGEPQWYHAAIYDAVGLLNAAAADVGFRSSAIRSWLLSLGKSRPAYAGVLGAIDFTGQHVIPAKLVRPSATGWELVR